MVWLQPAELIAGGGRPLLHSGEIEHSTVTSVDIYCEDDANFPPLKSGTLVLTSFFLTWIHPSATGRAFSLPLSAISNIFSSKKSIAKMLASPRMRLVVSAGSDGGVVADGGSSFTFVLVLRGKIGVDSFFRKMWCAWRDRGWEIGDQVGSCGSVARAPAGGDGFRVPLVGVAGILRKEQEMLESTDNSMRDAFHDLNALMVKAKDMVILAEKMRVKLISSSKNDEDNGSKQEIQDWLLSVGIVSPVTKEASGALYHQQLSCELADFVKFPLEKAGGVINIVDIYCLYNRARGTELISPEDLLQACSLWEKSDSPVMLRKFDSGVMVIKNKFHGDDEIHGRIRSLVLRPEALEKGVSASDTAMTLGIAPAMAKEHLLSAESKGILCRDVSSNGFRFYINIFPEIGAIHDLHVMANAGVYATWANYTISSHTVC